MIKPNDARPDALLGWMDSLADETRLRLLHLLERHELGGASSSCVTSSSSRNPPSAVT
jgi:hypothetical protein